MIYIALDNTNLWSSLYETSEAQPQMRHGSLAFDPVYQDPVDLFRSFSIASHERFTSCDEPQSVLSQRRSVDEEIVFSHPASCLWRQLSSRNFGFGRWAALNRIINYYSRL